MRLSLLLLSVISVAHAVQPCTDQPYFNYKCTQLVRYCEQPQAMRIRKSCPLSCGMCRLNSRSNSEQQRVSRLPPPPRIYQQFNRAIRRESSLKSQLPSFPRNQLFFSRPNQFEQNQFGQNQFEQKAIPLSVAVPEVLISDGVLTDGLKIGSFNRWPTESQIENNLRECCRGNFISNDCLSLCSYHVEPQQIISKALSLTCSERDANIWLRCMSVGTSNDGCCEKQRVVGCANLCNARFSVFELMTCIEPYLRPILQCHKDFLLTGH